MTLTQAERLQLAREAHSETARERAADRREYLALIPPERTKGEAFARLPSVWRAQSYERRGSSAAIAAREAAASERDGVLYATGVDQREGTPARLERTAGARSVHCWAPQTDGVVSAVGGVSRRGVGHDPFNGNDGLRAAARADVERNVGLRNSSPVVHRRGRPGSGAKARRKARRAAQRAASK